MKICPKCNNEVVPVIYGRVLDDMLLQAENKKIFLAGCNYSNKGKREKEFYCYKCNNKFLEHEIKEVE